MDAALLAAIQKGRGLKKSPRRPSMARRTSANAGNAPAAKAASPAAAPPPPAAAPPKAPGGPPKAPPPPPPPPPPKGKTPTKPAKAPPPPKPKPPSKPAAPPPPKPPPSKPAAPPPPKPPPSKPAAPPPPKSPPSKPAAPPPPPPKPPAPAAAPPPPKPKPALKSATPPPPKPRTQEVGESQSKAETAPAPAAPQPSRRKSVSFSLPDADKKEDASSVSVKEAEPELDAEMESSVPSPTPATPSPAKGSGMKDSLLSSKTSKSPISSLGLDINSKYVPAKDKPKAVQKNSPKIRHRRKSALKKTSSDAADGSEPREGLDDNGVGTTGSDSQDGHLDSSVERIVGEAGAAARHSGEPRGGKRSTPAAKRGARARMVRSANEEESEYEFDIDSGSERMLGSKQEKEAYTRHIPLEPLRELEPLHKIIPLEDLLQDPEEDQMVVSTREFNATVQLFKDRERKYQEAIQILEERNRSLSKVVVERDNVIAYLQAKLQSPTKKDHRRGSYRELDLDSMDAEEYPVLGLRNTSMPSIPGLSSYIEKPSPSFSSRISNIGASPASTTRSPGFGDSISKYLSTSVNASLVDQVYSSPFKSSSYGESSFNGKGDYNPEQGIASEGGAFSSRYASELKTKSPGTPSKKFERRLTKFDKSSIFSKYT